DAEAPAENEIIVGKTNRESDSQFDRESLGKEGFMIDIDEGRIFLVGGEDVGTLYSAYTFLEEHLGCRFYTYDFERVPQNESIGLLVCEDTQIPVIATRSTSWYDINDGAVRDKRKLNFHRTIWATGSSHTLPILAGTGDGGNVGCDPCLSNENTFQIVLDSLKSTIKDSNPDYVSVSQADKAGFCSCADCMASIQQYGYSGHYLRFVNRIAEALADLYPGIIVHTFAYHFTVMPPKGGIVPADNVMVQLCTIECCHNHPLAEYAYSDDSPYIPEGTTFRDLISEWSTICDKLSIWDYTTSFSMYNMINPNLYVLYDNIRLFAENKVHYTYMQGNRNSTAGEFSELRGYLISKLLWDPFMSREEYFSYMDEFLRDYYGPGWQEIRSWIDLLHEEGNEKCYGTWEFSDLQFPLNRADITNAVQELTLPEYSADELRSFRSIDWDALYDSLGCQYLYPNKIVIEGYRSMHAAMDLAETEEQRSRIDRLTIQLDVACSCINDQNHPKAVIIPMLFAKALEPHIANGTFSEDEVTSLKFSFMDISDAYIQQKTQYCIDYNRALAQKMLDHGVNAIYEGGYIHNIPFESLNFENLPGGGIAGHDSWLEIE
ncbi:MAG: DUF4838 domain-containing protein, partial [Clostridia bacterium]|nr:DUF4838 domain-containing protein [Clostridia bacterium]